MDKSIRLPAWLERGVADLFPEGQGENASHSLAARLIESSLEKRPLRIKLGIDPTATALHLGHSILFRKLRAFQDAGHTAVLIIGDFTARIGDPTGKSSTRVQLTEEQVQANSVDYLAQLGEGQAPENSLLDFQTPGRLEVHRNSEWLKNLDLLKIIDLLSTSTVGQMLAKEDFGKRYNSGIPISLHEFLYPLLQGFDSVAVKADVELGGTDQKFNIGVGRDLQRHFNQPAQFGLLMPILVGLDGTQKMSKSLGNTVEINEDALSMYSKLEKVADALVSSYLILLTDLDPNDLPSNPRERQKAMAKAVTANRHGLLAAMSAQSDAEKLITGSIDAEGDIPEISISSLQFPVKVFYLLSAIGLCASSSEARRQIKGGAVRIDGEKIIDANLEIVDGGQVLGKVIQIGKKTFRRLVV